MNGHCRITAHPFVTGCNKRWWIALKFGANLQDKRNIWQPNQYVTLECKNKGKK